MKKQHEQPPDQAPANRENEVVDRRQLVKKMGKFAAFTAPTLTVLLTNAKAAPGSGQP